MKLRIQSMIAIGALLCSLPCGRSFAQSFSVATNTTPVGSAYSYAFTLNYDQAGDVQALTDNIWEWSFYLEPNTPIPVDVSSPSGWKFLYTATTGEFDWYTEGPNGYAAGDFGKSVIIPGGSLSGFQLTTPLPPDVSVVTAYDQQFNSDANTATLPAAPAAVPEASTAVSLGIGLLSLLLVAMRRYGKRKRAC